MTKNFEKHAQYPTFVLKAVPRKLFTMIYFNFVIFCSLDEMGLNFVASYFIYRKIPMISPGVIFVQKAFFAGLLLLGSLFSGRPSSQNELPSNTTIIA